MELRLGPDDLVLSVREHDCGSLKGEYLRCDRVSSSLIYLGTCGRMRYTRSPKQ